MKGALSCFAVLLMLMVAISAQALEFFVPYDNFSSRFLDERKWTAQEASYPGVVLLENGREIEWGRFHMVNRVHGNTGSNSGLCWGANRLNFKNGDEVTAIKASVTVMGVEAKGCSTNAYPTTARARLNGIYFNTGQYGGGNLNDVVAYIAIQRASDSTDKPNLLRIVGRVVKCTDSGCLNADTINQVDLGTVKLLRKVDLSIQWDKDNQGFIFQVDNNLPVFAYYGDQVPEEHPPFYGNWKLLDLNHRLPNCTAWGPPPVAFMDVYFDNVFVNESAAP